MPSPKTIRVEDYKVIHPEKAARFAVLMPPKTAAVLSRLQAQEQKRRDRKVSVKELVQDIIHGRVRVD